MSMRKLNNIKNWWVETNSNLDILKMEIFHSAIFLNFLSYVLRWNIVVAKSEIIFVCAQSKGSNDKQDKK
jgi:hypothetical protein